MKKILFFIIVLINRVYAQDIINPYLDYNNQPFTNLISHNTQDFNSVFDVGTYNGEYALFLDLFPWGTVHAVGGNNPYFDLNNYSLSYKIELVSFPFSLDCAFPSANDSDGGCAGAQGREFNLPSDNSYDSINHFWSYPNLNINSAYKLWNITDELPIIRINNLFSSKSDDNFPCALVSGGFNNSGGIAEDRTVLSHSILKHTINIHCGQFTSNIIIGTYYFYTDLTRARMREYPFKDNSAVSTNIEDHDLVLRPSLFPVDYFYDINIHESCNYTNLNANRYCNDPANAGYEGNNINYTPFDPANDANCLQNDYIDASYGDIFGTQNQMERFPLPSYSIISGASVRNFDGSTLAGYKSYATGVNSDLSLIYSTPIIHEYQIDKNIDLTNINPDEKVIYNPSEVNILADDIHFPTNYTFKTIRGVYPYASEVDAADIPENGGPFTNPNKTDIPVKTDLFKDFHITNTAYSSTDHKFASIYHLISGSKLTIEPCVKIFDATFEINPGSEMVFEHWSTNQINVDRYQLLYNGGTVTKKEYSFLFQNFMESKKILRYESGDFISAGENVDVNAVNGDYTIEPGADVTFKAENQITLEPGFEVKAGGDFLASIGPVIVPVCGPLRLKSPNTIKKEQNEMAEEVSYFVCSPNPATENTFFMFEIKDKSNATISVYDVMGNLVQVIGQNSFITKGRYTYSYNVKDLSSGLYIAKLNTGNSEKSLKFIKQ